MYFGRHTEQSDTPAKTLPVDWIEGLNAILNASYNEEATKDNRFFECYGEIYEKEFVVIVSYLHKEDVMAAPITLFLSHDNLEDSKKFKATLGDLMDLVGLIFDNIFSEKDWCDYNSVWSENQYKSSHFFYKITRENTSLTLQAEALLTDKIKL